MISGTYTALRYCTDCQAYQPDITPADTVLSSNTAAEIFGPQSQLFTGPGGAARPLSYYPWMESYAFEILTVGIVVLYCFILYNYRTVIFQTFKMQTRPTPIEKTFEEQTSFFKSYLRFNQILCLMLLGGMFLRLLDFSGLSRAVPILDKAWINLTVPFILACFGLVWGYRTLLSQMIGNLTLNKPFFERYRFMNKTFTAFSSLIITPLFLTWALSDGSSFKTIIYLTTGLTLLLYLFYLGKSYRFFMERNVSFLQWILYLCAVEIFPVSFLLLFAIKINH